METQQANDIKIVNTTKDDLNIILDLFENAMKLQGKNGYKVWDHIDRDGLVKDIEKGLQYKISNETDVLCIFSVQYNDPYIWRERDKNDAIYLHRIVVNPKFKGQKQFEKVFNWAKHLAQVNNLNYIRMDTWADNTKIIKYYQLFGFEIVESYKTGDTPELPIQNRNLNLTLLEVKLNDLSEAN